VKCTSSFKESKQVVRLRRSYDNPASFSDAISYAIVAFDVASRFVESDDPVFPGILKRLDVDSKIGPDRNIEDTCRYELKRRVVIWVEETLEGSYLLDQGRILDLVKKIKADRFFLSAYAKFPSVPHGGAINL
jgi:hypothetical protein